MDIFRRSKSTPKVGLNIGSSSVRVARLVDKDWVKELVSFGIEPIKKDHERADLIEAVKKVMQDAGITAKRVNTSISGQSVIVRYIELPKMTKEELAGAIRFEAEKYIPFKIADVILDHQVLDEPRAGKMKVLLVAAKAELIQDHIKVIEGAGLTPALIDYDSFTIINSFQMNNPDATNQTVALLNIGSRLTNISILNEGVSYFTRDVKIAGDDITKAIVERLSLEYHAAEELKHNPGQRETEISETIRPVLENFLSEIRLSFDYYESQFEKGIDKVYLSGGSARLRGLTEFLKEGLRLEIEVWDPTRSLEVGTDADRTRLAEVAPSLAVCIGLALRKA